ncbi:MAG: hypothetical protein Q9172_003442 [Xanthocarpia lactea]
MALHDVDWGASELSDDDTVGSTSTESRKSTDQPYNLESVLAERTNNGEKEYLVKWEGCPDYENTWEVKEQFQSEQTLLDWRDQKMQITRGRARPFDVYAWQRMMDRRNEATEKRRARRREKKIKLGILVIDPTEVEPPGLEPSSYSEDSSDDNSSDLSGSNPQSRAGSPVWTPREETTLLEALQRLKEPSWDEVLKWYGPQGTINQALQQRTAKGLYRKAVALKQDFDASGKVFPVPILLSHPSSDRSFTIPTISVGKHARHRTSRDELMSECLDSLEGINRAVSGPRSEAQTTSRSTSPRKRKPDHQVSQRVKNSERPRKTFPAPMTTAGKSTASTKPLPASPSSPLPNQPAIPYSGKTIDLDGQSGHQGQPDQLGTIGRGTAMKGFQAVKAAPNRPNQQVNVLGNWGAQPNKTRKSRYEMKDPTDPKVRQSGKFKKFSTQRKFELAARYELTPDVNSLTFVDLKDGKTLTKRPTSVVRKPPEKTPFQLLQESMKEKQDKEPPLHNDTLQPRLERASTTESYTNRDRLPELDSKPADDTEAADAPAELTASVQLASLPFEKYSEHGASAPRPFAAPVAMMGSDQNQSRSITSEDRRIVPQANVSITPPPGNEEIKIVATIFEKGSPRRASISAPQQTEERPKINGHSGSDAREKISSKPSSPGTAKSRIRKSFPLSSRPSPSRTKGDFTPRKDRNPINEPVTQSQPVPPWFQPQDNGYALYPFDIMGPTSNVNTGTHNGSTDVIAEILVGPYGETTDTVIFRGLDSFELKNLFLTIKVHRRQMHVKCKTMCTAGEYATCFHHGPSYMGSGYVVPFKQSMGEIDAVSSMLAEHASGGLFFAERFSLLIYPARCVAWEFLDKGFPPVPPDTKLRFAMFVPWPQFYENEKTGGTLIDNLTPPSGLQRLHINRVFRTHFGIEFHRIVAHPNDKDVGETRVNDVFFLIFPPGAREDLNLIVEWIQANNNDAVIYRHNDRGAWDHFRESVENGVIICHESFFDYWAIPRLAYALMKRINMFNYSLEPMSPHSPDPHLIRLFPSGQALLLTDSLFLLRPMEVARILLWYRLFILPNRPSGTWKVSTRPAIREWLLRLQERFHYPHGKDFVRCYGEIMRLLPHELTKEWDPESPKDAAPIACMGNDVSNFDPTLGTSTNLDHQGILRNDVTLVNWFAGWAMMKQEKFRRFYAITGWEDESDLHISLKDAARKFNHVRIMSFERFEQTQKDLNWSKIEREEEKRRKQAAKVDEELRQEAAAKEQSPDLPDYEVEEMPDTETTEEESLFLPMEMSPSQQEVT